MNEKLSTVYTGDVLKAKFTAQAHVETARRTLKPDGDYKKSNTVSMEMIKTTAETLATGEGFKNEMQFITIAFTSKMIGKHLIEHVVECGKTSVTMNESV